VRPVDGMVGLPDGVLAAGLADGGTHSATAPGRGARGGGGVAGDDVGDADVGDADVGDADVAGDDAGLVSRTP
jgi:hypothetical protein